MSTDNRLGRNPFEKTKTAKAPTSPKVKKALKTSDKRVEAVIQAEAFLPKEASPTLEKEEQIIGELIDLPEENCQPLTTVPAQFFKQILARWI